MRNAIPFFCLALSFCVGAWGQSQEPQDDVFEHGVRREHYIILAAENTELQKFLSGNRAEDFEFMAHLLIDGQALIGEDETLQMETLDWQQLRRDLASVKAGLKDQSASLGKPQGGLMIHTYFYGKNSEATRFVNWSLEGFARQSARFKSVKLTSSFSNGGKSLWDHVNAIIGEHDVGVDLAADESPKENDFVKVFPVRTFFSRLRTDNADCVVVIKPKFSEEFNGELPRSVRTSMSVFSRQLEFDRKRRVAFSMRFSADSSEEAKEWFLEIGAREMQVMLGFQSSTVSIGYQ